MGPTSKGEGVRQGGEGERGREGEGRAGGKGEEEDGRGLPPPLSEILNKPLKGGPRSSSKMAI